MKPKEANDAHMERVRAVQRRSMYERVTAKIAVFEGRIKAGLLDDDDLVVDAWLKENNQSQLDYLREEVLPELVAEMRAAGQLPA